MIPAPENVSRSDAKRQRRGSSMSVPASLRTLRETGQIPFTLQHHFL